MRVHVLALTLAGVLGLTAASARQSSLIEFPTSASADAQSAFLKGVAALVVLDYEAARDAFIEAQKLQPSFALAYWGEAMTRNHPLDNEVEFDEGRAALAKLASTPAARLSKAPVEREKAWIAAVEKLYGAGDKPARDAAYADAMRRMVDRFPEDSNVRVFCALALLGNLTNGQEPAAPGRIASILDPVLARHPQHPGALLYAAAANVDPARAMTGANYADAFVKVAPDAWRALHLVSHVYAVLGRWDQVSAIEERAASAPGSFRARVWLVYALAQQGRYSEARGILEQLDRSARDAAMPSARAPLAQARALWLIETRKWAESKAPMDSAGLQRGRQTHRKHRPRVPCSRWRR